MLLIAVAVLLLLFVLDYANSGSTYKQVDTSQIVTAIDQGQVKSALIVDKNQTIQVTTKGGDNLNEAYGNKSIATQGITTVGGSASGHGVSKTYGGDNLNGAYGRKSTADQQVVTLGGAASKYGTTTVSGGKNVNGAYGNGSTAEQQVFTAGP